MSFFGHKVLDNKDIYQYLQKYNDDDNCTIECNFNGEDIENTIGDVTYLSINSMPEFELFSNEELRLKDYAKIHRFLQNYNFGKIFYSSNINNNKSIFNLNLANKQSNEASLFESNTSSLFEEKDIQKSTIFGCSNINQDNNSNIGEGLLTSKNNGDQSVESNNNNQKIEAGLFSGIFDNINSINNNNFRSFQNNNEVMIQDNTSIKIPRNNTKRFIPKARNICNHENDFSFYNIEKINNNSGLICLNCFYKYHKDDMQNYIPIKSNNFEL